MENILHRIETLSKKEGITITALERKIGASKGVLSRALNNNTDIQAKWVQSIVENYPMYSALWLLTGKGPMLKDENPRPIDHHDNINITLSLIDKIGELSIQLGKLTKDNTYLNQKNAELHAQIDDLKKIHLDRRVYSVDDQVCHNKDIASEPHPQK